MNHAAARDILRSAWRDVHGRSATPKELLFTQAVAWGENQYGRAGQFAPWAAVGKFNWGALQRGRAEDGTCPSGLEPGSDAANARCFFVYPSDEEAARAFVTNLTGLRDGYRIKAWPARNVRIVIAMNHGTSIDVARAMRLSPPYYGGDPNASEEEKVAVYARLLDGSIVAITGTLAPPSTTKGPLLLLGGVALLGLIGWVTGTGPFDRSARRRLEPSAASLDRLRSEEGEEI